MEKKPYISIIIPVFNVEKYLEDCLVSLTDQQIPAGNFEVICVNDGSTDNSKGILDSFAEKYPNIKVIHKENSGVSTARNTGIDASEGRYIWFVDSDDFVAKDCLKYLISVIDKHSPEIIYLPKTTIKESDHYKGENSIDKLSYKIHNGRTKGNNVWRSIIKADIIRSNKIYFDSNMKYGEDTLYMYYIYAFSKGTVWLSVDNALYFYRNRESSAMNTKTVQNFTQRTVDLMYMSKVYQDELNKNSISDEEVLRDTQIRQYAAMIGALTIFPKSTLDYKKTIKALKAQHLYPIPALWRRVKGSKGLKNKAIEFMKLFFGFKPYYRLYYLIVKNI